MYEQVLMK